MAESLAGTIDRVTFHNAETGYAVLKVVSRGRRGITTVVGRLLAVTAGELVEAEGQWVIDPQHGEQFRADMLRCTPPSTVEGIEKYLASGLVKGIGPTYARKIVAVFGERTLQVIDESPSFLKEIKGLGAARIKRIRESWREQKAVRDIMIFLQSHGLGTQRAVRIYKTYGDRAVEIVRENPYRLATDIWGVGFQTADDLGRKLGIDPASLKRARAALCFTLQQLSLDGHVGYPEEGVLAATEAVPDLPPDVIREAVEVLRKEGEIVREPGETPWLYLKPLFLAELGIARAVRRLQEGEHPLGGVDFTSTLSHIDERMGIQLAPSQREALRRATTQKVLVVTGGPGTGKTTIVRGILELFASRRMRCALCAPTGRAARRLGETTGREAKTIHRLLEFDPALGGFKRTAVHPLETDLLVVDEASMVDVPLMNQLLAAVPRGACVILVGDTDQLPSVGPGTVLADLIASRVVPVVRLAEIFRQAGQSRIIRAAHDIKEGLIPESTPAGESGDFYFLEANSPEAIIERVLTLVRDRIPAKFGLDPIRDIQILAPMNRCELGTQALKQAAPGGPRAPRSGATGRALRDVLPRRRQGDAAAEQLHPRGLQRRRGPDRPPRRGRPRSRRALRRPGGRLRPRRTRRDHAGARMHRPQSARLGVPRRRHPAAHAALQDAPAEPPVYRRHARQARRGRRRQPAGAGDGNSQRGHVAAVLATGGATEGSVPEVPGSGRYWVVY